MQEPINYNNTDEALGICEAIEATRLLLAVQWEETRGIENEQKKTEARKRIFHAQDELFDLISKVWGLIR